MQKIITLLSAMLITAFFTSVALADTFKATGRGKMFRWPAPRTLTTV